MGKYNHMKCSISSSSCLLSRNIVLVQIISKDGKSRSRKSNNSHLYQLSSFSTSPPLLLCYSCWWSPWGWWYSLIAWQTISFLFKINDELHQSDGWRLSWKWLFKWVAPPDTLSLSLMSPDDDEEDCDDGTQLFAADDAERMMPRFK